MSTVTAPPGVMSTEELLALPADGLDRWLIRGQLRERPTTVRNRWHSRILMRIGWLLGNWLDTLPPPRGAILGGEVGCRLARDPDTTVGIDLIYVGQELARHEPPDTTLIDGVPILAVEILSPSDTLEDIDEKVDSYLQAGGALVWVVDPHDQTVLIYRPGVPPTLVNTTQELSGEPHLPGFRVPVARIFEV